MLSLMTSTEIRIKFHFFQKTNRIVNRIETNPESNSTTGHSLPHNNWKIFEITWHRYFTVQRNTEPMCMISYKMEAKIDLKSYTHRHTRNVIFTVVEADMTETHWNPVYPAKTATDGHGKNITLQQLYASGVAMISKLGAHRWRGPKGRYGVRILGRGSAAGPLPIS